MSSIRFVSCCLVELKLIVVIIKAIQALEIFVYKVHNLIVINPFLKSVNIQYFDFTFDLTQSFIIEDELDVFMSRHIIIIDVEDGEEETGTIVPGGG